MSLDTDEAEKALWVGTGATAGAATAPLFKDPEQLRRKFRAWMWPHDFEVKYIEFWPDHSWGAIGLENPGAVAVLLEHSKDHPFKPEQNGKVWEIAKYATKKDPVFQNLLKTNQALRKSVSVKPEVIDNIIKSRPSAPETVDSGTSPTPPKAPSPPLVQDTLSRTRHKSGASIGSHLSRGRPSSRPLEELKDNRSQASSPGFTGSTPEKKKKKKKKHHRSRSKPRRSKKEDGILNIEDVVSSTSIATPVMADGGAGVVVEKITMVEDLKDVLKTGLREFNEEKELKVEDIEPPPRFDKAKFVKAIGNMKRFYDWSHNDDPLKARESFQGLLKELFDNEKERRHILEQKLADAYDIMCIKEEQKIAEEPRWLGPKPKRVEEPIEPTLTSGADFLKEIGTVIDPIMNNLTPIVDTMEEDTESNILNIDGDAHDSSVTSLPTVLYGGIPTVDQIENLIFQEDSRASTNLDLLDDVITEDEKTITVDFSRYPQPLESLIVAYTDDLGKISKAFQAPKNLDRWYALETWLKIHYFDRHKELSSLYARWVICVLASAGQTPVGLETDMEVHMSHGLDKFCCEMADILEKYLKQTGEDSLGILNQDVVSISTIVHATLCYLIAKHFPAYSMPRPLNRTLQTIPYSTSRTFSLYQTRGIVVKYFSKHLGLIQTPKGKVFFGPANVFGDDQAQENVQFDLERRLPKKSYVLLDASCYIDQFQGKKLLYMIASRVTKINVKNLGMENKESFYSLDLINNGGQTYQKALRGECIKEVYEAPEQFRPVLDFSNLSVPKAKKQFVSELSEQPTKDFTKELNKLCENLEGNDILDFPVSSENDVEAMVVHFKSRLHLDSDKSRGDQAQERERMYLANHYASVWVRIGFGMDQLEEDFHSLYAIGSWGCVMFNWESLLVRFHLPYCVDLTNLLTMTCEFISQTEKVGQKVPARHRIDCPEVMIELSEMRAHHEKHYMVVKSLSNNKDGRFSEDLQKLGTCKLGAIKRIKEIKSSPKKCVVVNGVASTIPPQPKNDGEVKIKNVASDEVLSFETDRDGNLSLEKVALLIKGVLALKYQMNDNVWKIVSMEGSVLQKPQGGWGTKLYIPIISTHSRSTTPCPSELAGMSTFATTTMTSTGPRVHYLDGGKGYTPISTPRPSSSMAIPVPVVSSPGEESTYSLYLKGSRSAAYGSGTSPIPPRVTGTTYSVSSPTNRPNSPIGIRATTSAYSSSYPNSGSPTHRAPVTSFSSTSPTHRDASSSYMASDKGVVSPTLPRTSFNLPSPTHKTTFRSTSPSFRSSSPPFRVPATSSYSATSTSPTHRPLSPAPPSRSAMATSTFSSTTHRAPASSSAQLNHRNYDLY